MGRAKLIRLGWIVAAIVGAGLAAALIWNISAYQTQSTLDARYRAQDRGERASESIERTCRGAEPGALVECIAKEIEATRADQRAEYDLSAQERMAKWALWMMVVTAITTGLTAVALWFIKGTLDATRAAVGEAEKATASAEKAVEITREAAEHQLRAYVYIDSGKVVWYAEGVKAVLCVKNGGTTPARSFSISSVVEIRDQGDGYAAPPPYDAANAKTWSELGPGSRLTAAIEGDDIAEHMVDLSGKNHISFRGVVRYVTIFNETMETEFSLALRARPGRKLHDTLQHTPGARRVFVAVEP